MLTVYILLRAAHFRTQFLKRFVVIVKCFLFPLQPMHFLYKTKHCNILSRTIQLNMEYILDRPGFSHLIYSILNHLDIPTLARLELVCQSWRNFIMREQVWQYVLDNRIAIEGSLIRNRLNQHYLPYEDIQRDRENGDFESVSKMLRKIVWRIERGFLNEWKNNYANLLKIKDARFIRAMTLKGQYVLYVMGGAVIVRPLFPIMQESEGPSKTEQEVKTIPKVELSGCHRREVFELDVHGKFVATVGRDRKLVLWTIDWNIKGLSKEAIEVQYVVNEAHRRLITAVKFIDTHTLATSSRDHTIKIWKIKKSTDEAKYTLYSKQTLHNHTHSVWCIDVTKDFIVSGSTDKIQRAWKFDGMQWIEHHAFRGHSSGMQLL